MPAIINSNNVLLGGNGGGGSVNYEGVAPIVVNNDEYKISAQAWKFEPGTGIQFVDNTANSSTTINVTGVGDAVTHNEFNSYTATADVTPYTAGANINITNHVISGKSWANEISNKLDTTAANSWDKSAYSAGSNINITNHVISGKDWTNTITAASAYAATMATGKEYTGIAPIVVNNTSDQISAQTTELIAGDGIEFVTAATSTTINCTAAGGAMNVTDGYTSYSALGIYDQGNDPGCFQIMGTAVNSTAVPGTTFGYTIPMQARNFSGECVDSAKNYADSAISAHIKYVNYGALGAGTVTFANIRDTIVNGGIVVPYEIKMPGNTYFAYQYAQSSVVDSTTAYAFVRYDAGGNCHTLTVSSYNNGATTGAITASEKVFALPGDVNAVDRIVLVATSASIPASGATDNKVYIVTGS